MDGQREHGQGMEKKKNIYIYIQWKGISEKSRNKNHLFEHIFFGPGTVIASVCCEKRWIQKKKGKKGKITPRTRSRSRFAVA